MKPTPLFLVLLAGWLVGCAVERVVTTQEAGLPAAADSALAARYPARKIKIVGNVIIQAGQGNTASQADNRKAGQRQGSAATAPNAVATTTSKNAGTPWWVFAGVLVAGAAGWEWLRGQLSFLPFRR